MTRTDNGKGVDTPQETDDGDGLEGLKPDTTQAALDWLTTLENAIGDGKGRFLPVDGKAPIRKGWESATLCSAADIVAIAHHSQNIGMRLGDGIVALDIDGAAGERMVRELAGGEPLPKTLGFTSGRPDHYQLLFRVPTTEGLRNRIDRREERPENAPKGYELEGFELRGNKHQSVVCGKHPTTGKHWRPINPDSPIADIPPYLLKLLLLPEERPKQAPIPTARAADPERYRGNQELVQSMAKGRFVPLRGKKGSGKYTTWRNFAWGVIEGCGSEWTDDFYSQHEPSCLDELKDLIKAEASGKADIKITFATTIKMAEDAGWHNPLRRGKSSGEAAEDDQAPEVELSSGPLYEGNNPLSADLIDLGACGVSGFTKKGKMTPLSMPEGLAMLEKVYGDRLFRDDGQGIFRLDQRPLENEKDFYVALGRVGYRCSQQVGFSLLKAHARKYQRDTCREDLERIEREVQPLSPELFNRCAERYFPGIASSPQLANVVLKKWLISAIARRFNPGCDAQSMLVLASQQQGIGKTGFLRILAGSTYRQMPDGEMVAEQVSPYYCGDATLGDGGTDHKDQMAKCHRSWIADLQELDGLTSRVHAARLKSIISESRDTIRPPYGERAIEFHRRFVFGGATNDTSTLRRKLSYAYQCRVRSESACRKLPLNHSG